MSHQLEKAVLRGAYIPHPIYPNPYIWYGPRLTMTGIDPNNESLWKFFTLDLTPFTNRWGKNGYIRLDLLRGDLRLLIRNAKVFVEK